MRKEREKVVKKKKKRKNYLVFNKFTPHGTVLNLKNLTRKFLLDFGPDVSFMRPTCCYKRRLC